MSYVPLSAGTEPARRDASASGPSAVLGLREVIMLIVGVVIGAGIFKAPAMVAGMAGSTAWMFGAWILGGVISLIGALCYAELSTAYANAGGDYHFLKRAYGRTVSFLFGWARSGPGGHGPLGGAAADLMKAAFGTAGEKIISALVAIAALTSINATMIVGARTSYAMGRDWPVLGKLALWDSARGTPVHAMRAQSATALLLVLLGAWTGSGFKAMVEFTAPVFWLFLLLSGLALFVLRVREPEVERPFRVPLYPLLPLIFCASCAYMLWSSLSYVYSQSLGGLNAAWIGVGVLLAGAVLLWLVNRFPAKQFLSPNP